MSAPVDAERRLVTVLYADLVGHTELVTRIDPEDWRGYAQRYFAAMAEPIQRYGGTLEKFIGDAIFAVFGVPRAHEDDAARAVRAAVEMQEALARLNPDFTRELGTTLGLRIGIATGEAVAPGEAGGDRLVVGDLTTLAERLQRIAPPNGIVLSARTFALVAPLVEGEPLRTLELKGFPDTHQAVLLRRLLRDAALPGAGGGVAVPLVDRERELAALLEAGERLRAGQGQVVFIIGEAGLGKSRLTAELRDRLGSDVRFLIGRCHEVTQGVSHGAVLQLLRAYLEASEEETPETVRERLGRGLRELFGTATPEIGAALEHLLGVDGGRVFEERTRGLGPEEVRTELLRAVSAFWERAAGVPIVLMVEDLHWVDAASADVLVRLMELAERVSLVVLGTLRPERRSLAWDLRVIAERDYHHRYREIRLGPLSPGETEDLAAALLEQLTLPLDLKRPVAQRAEGNPFYVEEVVRSLRLQGGPAAVPRVPDTLQGVLQARMGALPPPTRRVLQAASVIGRSFPLRLLQVLSEADGELWGHLSALQRTDFLQETQRLPEPAFAFKHVLLQEAAYQTLLRRERRELHRRLAEALERESPTGPQLAVTFYHFLQGEAWPQAVEFGARAAAWSRDLGAHEQALGNFRQVVEILEAHPDAAPPEVQERVREAHGDLLVLLGRFDEARRHYAVLRTQARTAAQRAHAARKIAEAHRREGDMEQAIQHLHEALRILPPGADPVEEAWTHLDLGYIEDLTGRAPRSVLAHCERARVLATGRDPMLNARVFRLYTIAYVHLGDMPRAMDAARQAVQFAEQAGDDLEAAIAHNNLADVYKHAGELDLALQHVREGLATAARLEARRAAFHLATLRTTQGELHLARGEWRLAQEALEAGLRSLEAGVPSPRIRLEMLSHLAQALTEQGQPEEALRLLDEAQGLTEAYPLLRFLPLLLRIRAEAHLATRGLERAEAACLEGLNAVERYGSEVERPALLRAHARVAMERGEADNALRWLEEAVRILERRGQTSELGRVLIEQGRAHLIHRDQEKAAEALRRAREVFLKLGARTLVEHVDRLADLIR